MIKFIPRWFPALAILVATSFAYLMLVTGSHNATIAFSKLSCKIENANVTASNVVVVHADCDANGKSILSYIEGELVIDILKKDIKQVVCDVSESKYLVNCSIP